MCVRNILIIFSTSSISSPFRGRNRKSKLNDLNEIPENIISSYGLDATPRDASNPSCIPVPPAKAPANAPTPVPAGNPSLSAKKPIVPPIAAPPIAPAWPPTAPLLADAIPLASPPTIFFTVLPIAPKDLPDQFASLSNWIV